MRSFGRAFPPGFEWDEAKNAGNVRKHGVDFRDAVRVFQRPTLDRVDDRREYGEERVNSIGSMGGVVVVNVTHTDREGRVRVISARLATRGEREAYLALERGTAGGRGAWG